MKDTPQGRTEVISLRVTRGEKDAVKGVAAVRSRSESDILREHLLADVVSEWRALTRTMDDAA
jgi:hypothetical protein